eukprot:4962575-Pleurochrysis_carterae.AAC.1
MPTGGRVAARSGAVGKVHGGARLRTAAPRRGRRDEERIGGALSGYRAVKCDTEGSFLCLK